MDISTAIKSFDFKINDVVYTMYGTSVDTVKKNLADYDLPEIPKSITRSKRTTKRQRFIGDDFKRQRFMGVPIEQLKEPKYRKTFEDKMLEVREDDDL